MAHPAGGREGEEEQEEEEEEGKDPGLDSATIWSFDPRRLAAPKYHDEPVLRVAQCLAGPGFAPRDAVDGFGPQVRYRRHFFTLHRTPFLNGKTSIPETVLTFEAPRGAS